MRPSIRLCFVDGMKRKHLLHIPHMPDKTDKASQGAASLKELAAEKAGALHKEDSVEHAGDQMRERGANAWPVVEEDRKLVGMVDSDNPDWRIGGRGHDPKDWRVRDIMTKNIIFCYEDENCAHAWDLMATNKLTYLPVVDRDMRIVGIFSREEIQEKAHRSPQAQTSEHQ